MAKRSNWGKYYPSFGVWENAQRKLPWVKREASEYFSGVRKLHCKVEDDGSFVFSTNSESTVTVKYVDEYHPNNDKDERLRGRVLSRKEVRKHTLEDFSEEEFEIVKQKAKSVFEESSALLAEKKAELDELKSVAVANLLPKIETAHSRNSKFEIIDVLSVMGYDYAEAKEDEIIEPVNNKIECETHHEVIVESPFSGLAGMFK